MPDTFGLSRPRRSSAEQKPAITRPRHSTPLMHVHPPQPPPNPLPPGPPLPRPEPIPHPVPPPEPKPIPAPREGDPQKSFHPLGSVCIAGME